MAFQQVESKYKPHKKNRRTTRIKQKATKQTRNMCATKSVTMETNEERESGEQMKKNRTQ